MRVDLQFDALPGKTFTGEITKISPQADLLTRAFPVKIAVQNPENAILSGMFARANIIYATKEKVTMVHRNAVDRRLEGVFIAQLVIRPDGAYAALVPAQIGEAAGDYVQVLVNEPVKPGDFFITTGVENIKPMIPGMNIMPIIVTNADKFNLKIAPHPWMQQGPAGNAGAKGELKEQAPKSAEETKNKEEGK